MRKTSAAEKDFSPRIICTSPWRAAHVKALDNYVLEVKFVDGTIGHVEMDRRVTSNNAGVFSALKNIELFKKVYLEHGVVTWPGEIDLAPDAMYDEIKKHGKWILK